MTKRSVGELIQQGALTMSDGYRTKQVELSNAGFRIVRVADIADGKVATNSPDFVSTNRRAQIGNKLGRPGDVLLTTKGTVGRTAILPPLSEEVVYSPQVCFFRVHDDQVINAGYLRYWLSSEEFWRQARDRMNNTDMAAYINLADMRSLQISLPNIQEQRAISGALAVLDDKMAAIDSINARLDQLLTIQFRAISGKTSEKIPLPGLASFTKGVSYRSADLTTSSTALVTLKSITRTGSYEERGLKSYSGPYKQLQVVAPGEIVLAQTDLTQAADVVGRAVRVPSSSDYDVLVASLDLIVARPLAGVSSEVLLAVLSDPSFRAHCRSRTSGTTVLHLASNAVNTYMAPLMPPEMRARYTDLAHPMLQQSDALIAQRRTLADLRNTLLPALMSGRLRVRDAEKIVEGAA